MYVDRVEKGAITPTVHEGRLKAGSWGENKSSRKGFGGEILIYNIYL